MSTHRKKLIEVALPLAAINEASAKEKSIRHGHPSTLHLWWARRPLAACRAVLFAQFVDDPSSVPDEFPDEGAQEAERQRLFDIVKRLVQWNHSNDEHALRDAQREIARSLARSRSENLPDDHDIEAYLAANAPPVVDPFCGGGSIPLEAQRLGLRAHAFDLNPVAVLITKLLVEIPPRFAGCPPVNPDSRSSMSDSWASHGAGGLAEDVRYYGRWMRDEAERRIGHLYPKVAVTTELVKERPDLKAYLGRELTVIAWLWTRTVASPNPAANGQHVPLANSFVLSSKEGKEVIVVPVLEAGGYRFMVKSDNVTPHEIAHARKGTKTGRGANFRCLFSGTPIPSRHIKGEGNAGRMGVRLMAVVVEGNRQRVYLTPDSETEPATRGTEPTWLPEQELPRNPRWFSPPDFGMPRYADLFTTRQLVALTTFSDLVGEARALVKGHCLTESAYPVDDTLHRRRRGGEAYADAVATCLGFALSKATTRNCSLAIWEAGMDRLAGAFGRQAMPMQWTFAETNPLAGAGGDIAGTAKSVSEVLEALPHSVPGTARQADAALGMSIGAKAILTTDPPYYDNIGYADLSDFFYVWLRRCLGRIHPELFRTLLTPKSDELVATPYRFGGDREEARRFFEGGLAKATANMRIAHAPDYPMTMFYAYKQTETTTTRNDNQTASTGWETMLAGIVSNGFCITGTWPVRSETTVALKRGINALASSIVIACRPRATNAPMATRRDFTAALKQELPPMISNLQNENIAPVDLAQAAIGPGMAVFSRYAQVLEGDGEPMSVRRALAEINRVLDETLTEAQGEMDPDTSFCVAWFEQHGMEERPYGEAEVLFTAKATSFEGVERAGVLVGGGGKVRLKRRDELEAEWDPATDGRVADWECVQHLVRAMTAESGGGIAEAARLTVAMGAARAERARSLAYRLHAVSERNGWSGEALAYNVLATSWPQIQSAMAELRQGEQTQLPV